MHTQTPDAKLSMEKDRLISDLLQLEMPSQCALELFEKTLRATVPKAPREPIPQTASIRARRTELQALPVENLRQLLARTTAENARREEAKRFYNQRNAMADFEYWLGMDFWSLDEAVALLNHRDPRTVNRAAIEADIAPKRGKPSGAGNAPTPFTKFFLDLSHRAERSNALTYASKLTPTEVIRWAKGVMGPKVPAPLLAYLDGQPALPPPKEAQQEPQAAATATPTADELRKTKVKRSVLLDMSDRWRTVVSDFQHAKENGLDEAAKAPERSMWWQEAALDWAARHGKLRSEPSSTPLKSSVFRLGS